jgi:hypothetical protein
VVWDNSPIHRRKEVKEFLAAGGARSIHLDPSSTVGYLPFLGKVEKHGFFDGLRFLNFKM